MAVFKNVYFMYTKIQSKVPKYKSTTEFEWATDIVMSKEQSKAFKKQYDNSKIKAIDTEDFEGIFHCEPPFPDAPMQYVATVRTNAQKKDGTPIPEDFHPKVYVKTDAGKIRNVTKTVLVGNGSFGNIEITPFESSEGVSAKLKNILVIDLVEYKGGGAGTELGEEDETPGSELGDEDETLGEEEDDEEVVETKPKARRARKPAKPKADADEEDDDLPF